jgi:hypothetical protein
MNKVQSKNIALSVLAIILFGTIVVFLLFSQVRLKDQIPTDAVNYSSSAEVNNIDPVTAHLYGEKIGEQGSVQVNTNGWLTYRDKQSGYSFKYPKDSKIIPESECYRIEYGIGFVIFILPIDDSDYRCGARTGIGSDISNSMRTDHLVISGKDYETYGFHFIDEYTDQTTAEYRYFYDFHHMVMTVDGSETCNEKGKCLRIAYGLYQEVNEPLKKEDVDRVMETLRVIVESLKF